MAGEITDEMLEELAIRQDYDEIAKVSRSLQGCLIVWLLGSARRATGCRTIAGFIEEIEGRWRIE
jgi:hypothetical protein